MATLKFLNAEKGMTIANERYVLVRYMHKKIVEIHLLMKSQSYIISSLVYVLNTADCIQLL